MAQNVAALAHKPGVSRDCAGGGTNAESDLCGDGAPGQHPVSGQGLRKAYSPEEWKIGDAGDGMTNVGDDFMGGQVRAGDRYERA